MDFVLSLCLSFSLLSSFSVHSRKCNLKKLRVVKLHFFITLKSQTHSKPRFYLVEPTKGHCYDCHQFFLPLLFFFFFNERNVPFLILNPFLSQAFCFVKAFRDIIICPRLPPVLYYYCLLKVTLKHFTLPTVAIQEVKKY